MKVQFALTGATFFLRRTMFNVVFFGWLRRVAVSAAPALVVLLAGCASGGAPPVPHAVDVPLLEDRRALNPADVDLQVRLGAAYRAAGRLDEARAVLERARARSPRHPGAVLFLGLVYEDLYRFGDAQREYQTYLTYVPPTAISAELRGRLALLRQRELREAARRALAQEARGTGTVPVPGTVAVLPFDTPGADAGRRPLARALAELLTLDLSQADRLRALEHAQVQLLLDEMQQSRPARADAARVARLLGAEHVVQAALSVNAGRPALQAVLVRPDGAPARAGAPILVVAEGDNPMQLVDAQKRLALRIYEALGIPMTAAERERIEQRETHSAPALLAYGRGLEASDSGNLVRAAEHFAHAVALDSTFLLAREQAEQAALAARALRVATDQFARVAWATYAPLSAAAVPPPVLPELITRDPVSEALGLEGLAARTELLELILRRP